MGTRGLGRVLQTFRTVLIVMAMTAPAAGVLTPAAAQGSSDKLMAQGEKSLADGQYDTSIDQLSKAIKSGALGKPDMAKAFILRGQALQGKGSQARAVADFTNALWLEALSGSDTARAFALRGASRQKLGQGKSAAEDFRKAEAAQPGISQQFGGSAVATASKSKKTNRQSASGNDDEGFFGSLFGGSGDTAADPRPASRRTATRVTRKKPRGDDPVPRRSTSNSSDGIFGGLFGGGDDEPETQASSGPTRLTASGSNSNRTRLEHSNTNKVAVNRPGVLSDILPGKDEGPGPQRKPGTQQQLAVTPAPLTQTRTAAIEKEEPGFFERVFSGSSSSAAPASGSGKRATANGPTRLVARNNGPSARRGSAPNKSAGPATQRDTSLPTFVNQPRLTDRILANNTVEPGGSAKRLTRVANLPSSRAGVQPPSRRVDAAPVNVEPAQLDWNQTTRVERGQVAAPIIAVRPRTARPAARPIVAAPAPRRQGVATSAPRAAQPVRQRAVTPPARAQPVQRAAARAVQPPSRSQSSFGSTVRSASQSAGETVRSAVDWVGNAIGAGPSQVAPPARRRAVTTRVASAPVERKVKARATRTTKKARTTYRAPAKPAKRRRAVNTGGGGYVVQLASRQRRKDAEAAIRKVRSRHSAVFAGAHPYIVRAEIPGKGTYYRVRVGPYRTKAQVASICAKLKGRGQDCFATR